MISANGRTHPRYRFGRQVILMLPSRQMLTAECYDISLGGCSLVHPVKLPIGAKIQLGFTSWDSANPRIFAADAVVRHVLFAVNGGYRIGVQFQSMPESSRRILTQLLVRLANPLLDFDAPAENAA